ncbi:MAG: phosphoribulokinase [Acidimicrobiales bacterium]
MTGPMGMASASDASSMRPVMLGIAGDSAAGKTTLTKGLVEALGPERMLSICVDDYHRYDREERRVLPFTPLDPACNYVEIMEQHLKLLALGQGILKPVYNHRSGTLERPVPVVPRPFVIAEGLLPLSTPLARACFDATVFLEPADEVRVAWKLRRDTTRRGYDEDEVRAELARREPESARFIRPQRADADIVVHFEPRRGNDGPTGVDLDATMILRPTIDHPDLSGILGDDPSAPVRLTLDRDDDGKPVEILHIDASAPPAETWKVEKAIWGQLGVAEPLPLALGVIEQGMRSEPLALVQLILLFHLVRAQRATTAPS